MKKILKSINYCWPFVWKANGFSIILYFIFEFIVATMPLVGVYFFNIILDAIVAANTDKIILAVIVWCISLIIGIGVGQINAHIKQKIDARSTKKFEEMMAEKLAKMPLQLLESSDGKTLCDRALCSGEIVFDIVPFSSFTIIKELYTFIVSIIMLLRFNILIVIIYLLLVIPGIIVDYIFDIKMDDFIRKHAADSRKMWYYKWMLTDPYPAKDVRMYDLTDDIKVRFKDEYANYYVENQKLCKKQLKWLLSTEAIRRIGETILLGYVIFSAIQGDITIGNVAMYVGYATITSNSFYAVVQNFIGYLADICIKIMPGFFEFVEYKCPDDNLGIRKIDEFKSLQFKNVYFKYATTDKYVLNGVSFTLNCGEKLSIVGINGAGKTTIIKLILGIYEVDSGEILINGYPMNDYNIKDVRKKFSVLFQSFACYKLTLRENIALSDYDKVDNDDALIQALKKSGVYHEIQRKLENGLDSNMTRSFDDRGVELSKGQWQKIALSRVYFKNAEIIIFDEPSAALDAEAEDMIFNSFRDISKNKTGVMISHRISMSRISDKIIVLDGGKIVEMGSHDVLIDQGGLYSKLYNLQRDKYTVKE